MLKRLSIICALLLAILGTMTVSAANDPDTVTLTETCEMTEQEFRTYSDEKDLFFEEEYRL